MTPAERRAAVLVVGLLVLGAGRDLWRAGRPPGAVPARAPAAVDSAAADSAARSAPGPGSAPAAAAAPDPAAAALDLNRAGAADLDRLPGIGPTLARRIVDHREAHGPFRSVDELRAVRGIGPALLGRLRPRLRLGPAPQRVPPPPRGPAPTPVPSPDPGRGPRGAPVPG